MEEFDHLESYDILSQIIIDLKDARDDLQIGLTSVRGVPSEVIVLISSSLRASLHNLFLLLGIVLGLLGSGTCTSR